MTEKMTETDSTPPVAVACKDGLCGLCGGGNIRTEYNIGYDIDIDGEEFQHRDVCRDCGATRSNIDIVDRLFEEKNYRGKWIEKGHPGAW